MSRFEIWLNVTPNNRTPQYRIVEIYDTIDGPRTRLTHWVFDSHDKAVEFFDLPYEEKKMQERTGR
jgi:hypothetical protein